MAIQKNYNIFFDVIVRKYIFHSYSFFFLLQTCLCVWFKNLNRFLIFCHRRILSFFFRFISNLWTLISSNTHSDIFFLTFTSYHIMPCAKTFASSLSYMIHLCGCCSRENEKKKIIQKWNEIFTYVPEEKEYIVCLSFIFWYKSSTGKNKRLRHHFICIETPYSYILYNVQYTSKIFIENILSVIKPKRSKDFVRQQIKADTKRI